jgi:hypothetical protein
LKRVVKRHLLGARIRENAAKTRGEDVVRARESMAQRVFAERASRGDERAAGGYGGLPLRRVHRGDGHQVVAPDPRDGAMQLRTYVCAECGHSRTYSVDGGES